MRNALLVAFALPLVLAAATRSPLRIDVRTGTNVADRATAPATASAYVPRRLDLVANEYGFTGPPTVAAGRRVVSVRNDGQKLHHVQLLRLTDGKSITDVFAALNRDPSVSRLPAWATPVGGPSAALPGATIASAARLTAGRYAVICWIPAEDGTPHFMRGMMMPIEVVDAGKESAPATGPLTTVIVREYGFQFIAPTRPGRRTIRVENIGSQPHELLIVRLNPGTSVEQVAAWSERGQSGPAPVADWTGVAALAPGKSATLSVDFVPGRYAVFCLSPDRTDGRSHVAHGMHKTFEVSAS
jgi:uncharacterized cupredoxin-like copper-binding protein